MKNMIKFLVFFVSSFAFCQVGIGTTSPHSSSILDLTATNKALLLPRVANTAAISSPINGMLIYDNSVNCIKAYENNAWSNCLSSGTAAAPSTGGTGVVSSYGAPSCTAGSVTGTMTAGVAVSGVTMTVYANVTTLGTYNITAGPTNGVTFSGSGTFTALGCQAITLTASGTPTAAGTHNYALGTTPSETVSATTATAGPPSITSSTGKIWMDRNLGASQVATSATDHLAYGSLYQWGRGNDGHANINWTSATAGTPINGTTTTLSTTDYPGNNLFILLSASPYDWRATRNDNLWQGVAGVNNPCPAGYRLPTLIEINAEVTQYSITNSATAFASPLKFTVPGYRYNSTGSLYDVGSYGYYWSSSVSGTHASSRYFYSFGTHTNSSGRADGLAVRCLKD